ncbi:MAG TPA: Uma2 family endonuclease [Thermoanaerobaculia bacterium]|nr:Uma2 family endonuclease [Thermoanaerobaculia bacterium]
MWTEEDLALIAEGLAWAAKTPAAETDLEDVLRRVLAERGLGEDFMTNKRRLFSIDEYHRMAEAGILAEDERLELIRGEIFHLWPIEFSHASSVRRLLHKLTLRLGSRAMVDAQNPILLNGQQSIARPDIAILRPQEDFYAAGTPGPEDILLVVDVADSSLSYDRKVKLLLYAEAGISEIWLTNPTAHKIITYRRPAPEGYQEVHECRRLEMVAPEAFPEECFRVDELIG